MCRFASHAEHSAKIACAALRRMQSNALQSSALPCGSRGFATEMHAPYGRGLAALPLVLSTSGRGPAVMWYNGQKKTGGKRLFFLLFFYLVSETYFRNLFQKLISKTYFRNLFQKPISETYFRNLFQKPVSETYFNHLSSQLKKVRCQKMPFCGFRTQWFSSG
jgi:hypothetical protein